MVKTPLLLVTAGLAAAALTACGGSPGDTTSPESAAVGAATSPEDVVRAYLGALQEHDEPTATSLTTQPYAGRDDWAADPPSIENVEVSAAMVESTTGTAAEGHAQAVFVPVTSDLRGGDGTMPGGSTSWGYVLVRDSDSEAWRIADAGSV